MKTMGLQAEGIPGALNLSFSIAEARRLAHPKSMPVSYNVTVMFGEVARETMVSVSVADEIVVVTLRWMHSRDQRSLQQPHRGKGLMIQQGAHALEDIGGRQRVRHHLHPMRQYGQRIEHRREGRE